MKQLILHLSHTDIRTDSRILKTMNALSINSNVKLYGIGIELDEGTKPTDTPLTPFITSLPIVASKLRFLPAIIRHTLVLLEIFFKMTKQAIRLKPNIIHAHDVVVLPIAVALKFITKAQLIYDAHELESNKNGTTPLLGWLTLLVEKLCWKKIDFFITVSESIKDWYFENISPKNAEVILNSPFLKVSDDQSQDVNSDYLRKLYQIPMEHTICIYVGILNKGRGINSFINTFSKLSKHHVIFLGYGDLAELIKGKGKQFSNIHYHPPVRHDEVVSITKSADIGLCLIENVSLSDYLCLPNKLFEYAFSGIKIIASDFPEITKIITKYNLGIVCKPDEKNIEDALMSFKDTQSSTFSVGRLHELSWEAQAEKLNNLYQKLLRQ